MIGTPVRSAAETKPPRPNRCSLYRSRERLADALEALREDADQLAGGEQPLGVRVAGQRVAGLAADRAENGIWKTRSAPSIRRWRFAGWWSRSATVVISASSGIVPEWLATSRAPPCPGCSPCRWSRPGTTSRRAAAAAAGARGRSGRGRSRIVDLVVAGDPAAQERQRAGERAPSGREPGLRPRCRRDAGSVGGRLGNRSAAGATGVGPDLRAARRGSARRRVRDACAGAAGSVGGAGCRGTTRAPSRRGARRSSGPSPLMSALRARRAAARRRARRGRPAARPPPPARAR